MKDNLQVRYERAQDAIGAYIEELSETLANAEANTDRASAVDGLVTIYWLTEEIRSAGVVRAKLSDYQQRPHGLDAIIQLFNQTLFALSQAKVRTVQQPLSNGTSFVGAVLSGYQAA